MSKANQVRELIANCKAAHDAPTEDLIILVMDVCGFKRQLARAYINNNWTKVQVERPAIVAVPRLTFEEALAQIPMREKGRFIAKAKREEMARALMEQAA